MMRDDFSMTERKPRCSLRRPANWIAPLTLILVIGCGGGETVEKQPIPFGNLPTPVVKAAQKKLPDVAFDGALQEKIRGRDEFTVSGKDKKGNVHSVKLSREGTVLSSD